MTLQNTEEAAVIPPSVTSMQTRSPIQAIVVGCGGTGGRLIPALMQVLRPGDTVALVDGDHVEDRNLARQNFRLRDVGENKAEVMARRYRRDGIESRAYGAMLTQETFPEILTGAAPTGRRTSPYTVLLGCVDNAKARQTMKWAMENHGGIWIDSGNEMRGGQVLLSAKAWPFRVKARREEEHDFVHEGNYSIPGLSMAMPQLLVPADWTCPACQISNNGGKVCSQCGVAEGSCADRIDLQTVAVNQLSATCMLNVLSNLLYAVPMLSCGTFFSTLNTMSPVRFGEVRWEYSEIRPEETYANKG